MTLGRLMRCKPPNGGKDYPWTASAVFYEIGTGNANRVISLKREHPIF